MLTGGWNNTGALLCVCVRVCVKNVWTQTAMRVGRSRQRTCQTLPSPPRRVSSEVLHFDPVSAHLPGEANWVRQMEWKHERRLIPFEDFDGKRNLRQFRVSLTFCLKYLQFAALCFLACSISKIYRSAIFIILIHHFSANNILNYV